MFSNKFGLGYVVSTSLILIIVIFGTVNFQNWYQTQSSSLFVEIDEESAYDDFDVLDLVESKLFLKSENNISINLIKINDVNCGINDSFMGIDSFNASSCISSLDSEAKIVEVVVFTNYFVFSKDIYYSGNSNYVAPPPVDNYSNFILSTNPSVYFSTNSLAGDTLVDLAGGSFNYLNCTNISTSNQNGFSLLNINNSLSDSQCSSKINSSVSGSIWNILEHSSNDWTLSFIVKFKSTTHLPFVDGRMTRSVGTVRGFSTSISPTIFEINGAAGNPNEFRKARFNYSLLDLNSTHLYVLSYDNSANSLELLIDNFSYSPSYHRSTVSTDPAGFLSFTGFPQFDLWNEDHWFYLGRANPSGLSAHDVLSPTDDDPLPVGYFDGYIGDFLIYDRLLNATETSDLWLNYNLDYES